jgi:hypothetical protein
LRHIKARRGRAALWAAQINLDYTGIEGIRADDGPISGTMRRFTLPTTKRPRRVVGSDAL